MKYPLNQLLKFGNEPFDIIESVDFSSIAENHHEIRHISKVSIEGTGKITSKMILFDLQIQCDITLPCALTLEDVIYPLKVHTVEYFTFDEQAKEDQFEQEVTIIKGQTVELAPVIWQNIVVNIPLRVVSKGASERIQKSGKNYEIIDKNNGDNVDQIDPRFAKLKDLL